MLEWIFRIGVAGCFIGHGAFGIIGKEAWLPYFAVAHIPESWAWTLMPVVGGVDIAMGVLALVAPRPAILAYMVFWAAWTALLRPLAGESVFETLERAGNYGLPLAFMVAVGFRARGASLRDWFRQVRVPALDGARRARLGWVLRATIAVLLVGHGGLAVAEKPLLVEHAATVGLGPTAVLVAGWGEILLGLSILVHPAVALLGLALAWKVGTEALFPLSGAPMWEFVERAGSYAAPLALLVMKVGERRVETADVRSSARPRAGAAAAAVLGALLIGAAAGPPSVLAAQTTEGDQALVDSLREGALILACRHGHTDRSRGDRRRVDLDDPSTQRVLSERGREEARRLGRAIQALGIPIGEVWASPYARTANSARLGFGRVEETRGLMYGNSAEQRRERRRLFGSDTAGGTRVLMTHQGILYGAFEDIERGSIREGDCLVVEPGTSDGPRVLARLGHEEFEALADAYGSDGDRTSPDLHTFLTGGWPFAESRVQIELGGGTGP